MNVVKRVSKGYFYSFLADSFFRSIRPYVTIIYTYLILDGLIDKIPQSQLLTYVFWMVGLNVVLEIILKILNYSKAKYLIELDFNLENQIAIKTTRRGGGCQCAAPAGGCDGWAPDTRAARRWAVSACRETPHPGTPAQRLPL